MFGSSSWCLRLISFKNKMGKQLAWWCPIYKKHLQKHIISSFFLINMWLLAKNPNLCPCLSFFLQHAHTHSSGFFITQDSSFGNLILPVIPRLEPETWPFYLLLLGLRQSFKQHSWTPDPRLSQFPLLSLWLMDGCSSCRKSQGSVNLALLHFPE